MSDAPVAFRVVDGKHKKIAGSEYGGVVSVMLGGGTERVDVLSYHWPIAFSFVVPSLEFSAILEERTDAGQSRHFLARQHLAITNARFALYTRAVAEKLCDKALSRRLVVMARRFGADLFDKLSRTPLHEDELIGGTPLVTCDHVRELARAVHESRGAVALKETFPPMTAQMAIQYEGEVTVDNIRHDPYVLYHRKPKGCRIDANPLHVADAIASAHLDEEVERNDERRLAAYYHAAISEMQKDAFNLTWNGSVWFARDAILAAMLRLQPPVWRFDNCMLDAMFVQRPFFMAEDEDLFTRAQDDRTERHIASALTRLLALDPNENALRFLSLLATYDETGMGADELEASFSGWRDMYDLYLQCDATQRSSLRLLAERHVLVLLGGAGTGKSKTLGLILLFFKRILDVDMKACAFTGKAVHRIKQNVRDESIDCRTLHSLRFCSEDAEALAIDEASMAPPWIVSDLLTERLSFLVICGDDHQLPSIDPGSFLRDVSQSNVFPTVRLQTVYRTGEGSGIATEAPKIFKSGGIKIEDVDVRDFRISLRNDLQSAVSTFGRLVAEHGDVNDVMMISNVRSTCKRANKALQIICNPNASDPEATKLARGQGESAPWVEGDRVINTKNFSLSCGKRIYNGMIGTVASVNASNPREVVVLLEGYHVTYAALTESLDHAYCVTAWKYQGSEVRHAIVLFESYWQLSCELLYTAVTRGQVSTTTFLSPDHLRRALGTRLGPMRVTRLERRLKTAVKKRAFHDMGDESDEP